MTENRSGIVAGLIAGVGGLILVTIIILMVVATVKDANLLRATATTSTVVNESGNIDADGYTLAKFDGYNRAFAITQIVNTTDGDTIVAANYTFSSTSGVIVNSTVGPAWDTVKITYTFIAPTNEESATTGLNSNLTAGINNVSSKIPTILLIGAVVLLFGVIVLLVRQSQAMGIGGGGSSGSL